MEIFAALEITRLPQTLAQKRDTRDTFEESVPQLEGYNCFADGCRASSGHFLLPAPDIYLGTRPKISTKSVEASTEKTNYGAIEGRTAHNTVTQVIRDEERERVLRMGE